MNGLSCFQICRLKSKEPPQTFVPKILVSWHLGIRNGPIGIARVFGTETSQLNKKLKTCNWKSVDIEKKLKLRFGTLHSIFTQYI